MMTGPLADAPAGVSTTSCPFSNARKETSAAQANCMAGDGGPLRVGSSAARPGEPAFVEACAESQLRRNDDFNGPDQEGAGLYQVTQFWGDARNGERCSAAAAYLHPAMNRPNLYGHHRRACDGIILTASAPPACAIDPGQQSVR